jgi:hypothetical protein
VVAAIKAFLLQIIAKEVVAVLQTALVAAEEVVDR